MLAKYNMSNSIVVGLCTVIIYLILVIRRVPNHSLRTACVSLFKLSTCSSLLIGRGHSTWFGVQILTQIPPHSCTYTSIHLMLLSTCSTLGIYMYGIGYTLNKLTMGFLFLGGQSSCYFCILLLFYFKLVYIVMLFALGIIWQSSFFKHNYM